MGVSHLDGLEGAELFRSWLPNLALFLQRNKASPLLPPTHLCPEAVGSRVLQHSCRSCADISRMHLTTASHSQSPARTGTRLTLWSVCSNHCILKVQLIVLSQDPSTITPGLTSRALPHSGSFLQFWNHRLHSLASSGPGGGLCCRPELQDVQMAWEEPNSLQRKQ